MSHHASSSTAPRETINELYFTGQGDPRHKCVAIGYHRDEPVVYKFDTVDLPQGTRTTVSASPIGSSPWPHQIAHPVPRARLAPAPQTPRPLPRHRSRRSRCGSALARAFALGPAPMQVTYNEQSVVAFFDWALAVHLGSVIKGADRAPMAELVKHGSSKSARSFQSGRGGSEKFEWRRVGDKHPYGYELFSLEPESRIGRYDPTPRELPKIGRAYALLEYGFHEENLIRDALLALCLNRWIDWRGM
ncbi:hypothetical protein VTO73DRAFT_14377 [Trametes versicolor]